MWWAENKLVAVRPGTWYGFMFDDIDEYRQWLTDEGCVSTDVWRDDKGLCWVDDYGPVLADVVEFVEVDSTADLTDIEDCVRALVSCHAPVAWSVVPVYGSDGRVLERVRVQLG